MATNLTECKCDFCLEIGEDSIATVCCKDCDKFFCDRCNQVHKRVSRNHNSVELDNNGKVGKAKRRNLESTEWKCNVCLERGDESLATVFCNNCDKFFCDKCNQVHKSLSRNHNSIQLDGNSKDEVGKAKGTNLCDIHKEVVESYCQPCNVCLCDTCYKTHLNQSPLCPSRPISVREEAVKKRNYQCPTLLQEIEDLKKNLQERNRKSQIYINELERECDLKCEELWRNYEDILDELRHKTHKICDELKILKNEQVIKWRELVKENNRLLKKLEIWCFNLQHFLEKDEENEMICGVELVESKLSSTRFPQQMKKCELRVEFSNHWLQFIEGLKNEMIASGSLNYSSDNLIEFQNEWNLPKSNTGRCIESILVSQKDNHIFLGDYYNKSIMEFTESGKLIHEFILIHEGREFIPREMFFTSSEILGVNCLCGEENEGDLSVKEEKLFFLERNNFYPFLKIAKIVDKKKNDSFSFSVCKMKKTILICDFWKFQMAFYRENGEYIKTIDIGESGGGDGTPLIRADPSTGNFWGAKIGSREIFCFDENGEKIESFETEKEIRDFFINKFGNFHFCSFEGIFSFLPEKNLHKFQKKSEEIPRIFVSSEKIFVYLQIDGKYLIKIFKILY